MCCRFPCCLQNGIGYANFLVLMIQLLPTSSYNCIRMGCLRGMMWQIVFSACWWWHFFLHTGYSFLHMARISSLTSTFYLFSPRNSQLHTAYQLRWLIQGHCNLLNTSQHCHFLQLIFMPSLSSQSWRLSTVHLFSFLLFWVIILLAVWWIVGTGIKQTLSSFQGV